MFAFGDFGSNPDLVPMKSRNFEMGVKAHWSNWLESSATFFYMPVRDEIIFILTNPPFEGRNENIDRTLRRGIEISLKGRYGKWLDGFLNYTFTKATVETDFAVFGLPPAFLPRHVSKGDQLPLVPRHRLGIGVNVHPLQDFTVSLFGTYVGSQILANDEPNDFKKLSDYFVLNSKISYRWRNFTTHLTLNNLTDRKYSTSGIVAADPVSFVPVRWRVPAPGFNAFAGIEFRY
jgi:iron complex outermembrane receptor protein